MQLKRKPKHETRKREKTWERRHLVNNSASCWIARFKVIAYSARNKGYWLTAVLVISNFENMWVTGVKMRAKE